MIHIATIILRNKDKKILLQFRDSNAPSSPLRWSFFGGHIEPGEDPLQAIVREIKEELCLQITEQECTLLGNITFTSKQDKECTWHLFECSKVISWPEIHIKEGAGAAFLSPEEILTMKTVNKICKQMITEYC